MKVKNLVSPLQRTWQARPPQQRKALAVASVLLLLAFAAWLLQAGNELHGTLRERVTNLRAQASGMEQQAGELETIRAEPPLVVSGGDLLSLVRTTAATAGLTEALTRSDALGVDQVAVACGAIAFADWLAWIEALQARNVRVESARIETLSTPALVSVTATLIRPALP
jgi:type II secretory pathway component PulM